MRVLVTGASGFIARSLIPALERRGHTVVSTERRTTERGSADVDGIHLEVDFSTVPPATWWHQHLTGVDVVVNLVGLFADRSPAELRKVHCEAPRELFLACAQVAVRRIVQVSALGAGAEAVTDFHRTKMQADDYLRQLAVDSVVVQPSLIFGSGGSSAEVFVRLATLPVIPLPSGGQQLIQPVHIDDVVAALIAVVELAPAPRTLPLVGPVPITLRQYLLVLRGGLGLRPARFVGVPPVCMRWLASIGSYLGARLINRSALTMLTAGNTGDPAPLTTLLGHAPRPAERFIEAKDADTLRRLAALAHMLPLLRTSLAAVWIVTGVLSFGIFPVEDSLQLLESVGIPRALAPSMLYGAAMLDLLLGALTLLRPRRWLWAIQAAVIVGYTAIIALRLPMFLVHPFGPVLKNLPILALLGLLWTLQPRGR